MGKLLKHWGACRTAPQAAGYCSCSHAGSCCCPAGKKRPRTPVRMWRRLLAPFRPFFPAAGRRPGAAHVLTPGRPPTCAGCGCGPRPRGGRQEREAQGGCGRHRALQQVQRHRGGCWGGAGGWSMLFVGSGCGGVGLHSKYSGARLVHVLPGCWMLPQWLPALPACGAGSRKGAAGRRSARAAVAGMCSTGVCWLRSSHGIASCAQLMLPAPTLPARSLRAPTTSSTLWCGTPTSWRSWREQPADQPVQLARSHSRQ